MGAQVISLLTILIATGSVVFLSYVMTKFIGKKSSGMIKSKYMKVIDRLSLGFDKNIYLIQVGEQYVLMNSSVKGFEFICNIDRELIAPTISNTPAPEKNNNFSKYFDFFRTSSEPTQTTKTSENHVNENMQRLKDLFNNKR